MRPSVGISQPLAGSRQATSGRDPWDPRGFQGGPRSDWPSPGRALPRQGCGRTRLHERQTKERRLDRQYPRARCRKGCTPGHSEASARAPARRTSEAPPAQVWAVVATTRIVVPRSSGSGHPLLTGVPPPPRHSVAQSDRELFAAPWACSAGALKRRWRSLTAAAVSERGRTVRAVARLVRAIPLRACVGSRRSQTRSRVDCAPWSPATAGARTRS